MTEVRFYHLFQKSVEEALPQLVSKTVEREWRSLVLAPSDRLLKAVSLKLWGDQPESFLAHGMEATVPAQSIPDQPVWLTTRDANPNKATVLFCLEGTEVAQPERFDLICDLFDGRDLDQVETARERWKNYKNNGFTLTYWQQTEQGWKKKA